MKRFLWKLALGYFECVMLLMVIPAILINNIFDNKFVKDICCRYTEWIIGLVVETCSIVLELIRES